MNLSKTSLSMILTLVFSVIASTQSQRPLTVASSSAPPPPSVVLELRDANQLLAQKRCVQAAAAYQKFLDKYPKDSGVWNLIGLAYLCDSKEDQAINAFKRALMITPTYTDVHNNLGVAYMELKNYDEAKNEFARALQDTSYSPTGPYYNLAKLAFDQENYEESRALARKVVDLAPKQPGPLLLYGHSLRLLGRTDEATQVYRDLLKLAPDNLESCFYLANLLLQKGQDCEAQQYLRKVVDADPLGELGQKSINALKNIHCEQ